MPITALSANGRAATSASPNDEPGSTFRASPLPPQPAPPSDDALTAAFWNFHSRPRCPKGPGEREGGADGARARESSVTSGAGEGLVCLCACAPEIAGGRDEGGGEEGRANLEPTNDSSAIDLHFMAA